MGTIPAWQSPVPDSETLNAQNLASERTEQVAGANTFIPILYGSPTVRGTVIDAFYDGETDVWTVAVMWGWGEIAGFVDVYLDGAEAVAGVTANHYKGTTTQIVDPLLTAAIGETYPTNFVVTNQFGTLGIAYSVFQYEDSLYDGFPDFEAKVNGRKVFDDRDPTQTLGNKSTWKYSRTPAVNYRDFLSEPFFGPGDAVNQASVDALADINDATLTTEARRELDLVIDQPLDPGSWRRIMDQYCGCWSDKQGDEWVLIPDRPRSADFTVTTDDFISFDPVLSPRPPTVVRCWYTDLSQGIARDEFAEAKLSGVDAGTVPTIVRDIKMPGVTRYTQALREASEYLKKMNRKLQFVGTLTDQYEHVCVGDVLDVSHVYGLTNVLMRVVEPPNEARPGRPTVRLNRYSADDYDDTEPTDPGFLAADRYIGELRPRGAAPGEVGILNGSFENGFDDWSGAIGPGAWRIGNDQALAHGSTRPKYAYCEATDGLTKELASAITWGIGPGDWIETGAWLATDSDYNGTLTAQISFRGSDNSEVAIHPLGSVSGGDVDWTRVTDGVEAPNNAEGWRLELSNAGQTAGACRADDVGLPTNRPPSAAAFAEKLPNGNFELGDVHWTKGANTEIIQDGTKARSGTHCLKLDGTSFGSTFSKGRLAVKEGDMVQASLFAVRESGSLEVGPAIQWLDSDDVQVGSLEGGELVGAEDDYQAAREINIAPAGAAYARMAIINFSASPGGNVMYVDDCGLDLVYEPLIGRDRFYNPDFAQRQRYWTFTPPWSITTEKVLVGKYAAVCVGNGRMVGNRVTNLSKLITDVSMHYLVTADFDGQLDLEVGLYDKTGNVIDKEFHVVRTADPDTDDVWYPLIGKINPRVETDAVAVAWVANVSGRTAGKVYVDDCGLGFVPDGAWQNGDANLFVDPNVDRDELADPFWELT